ncbi:hypothetical protein N3K66_001329 [Trichothecium roseum]|uniref:Uncharacterized protein n=1 Tax=Trichothecium roseum TaxID=47278 RepID=A0ACC0VG35_9HYPO|nr:hypothetical protein N3K66_001329 [Trichothecium roseum]
MPRRKASSPSEGESTDPETGRKQCEKRIAELKKARDEKTQAVVDETQTLLNDVRSRVQLHREDLRRQGSRSRLNHLAALEKGMGRRGEIKAEMTKLMADLADGMDALEELMVAGFHGRERDMQEVIAKRMRIRRGGREGMRRRVE